VFAHRARVEDVMGLTVIEKPPTVRADDDAAEAAADASSPLMLSLASDLYVTCFGDDCRRRAVAVGRSPRDDHDLSGTVGIFGSDQPAMPASSVPRTLCDLPRLAVRWVRLRGATRGLLRWWDGLISGFERLEQRPAHELGTAYRELWSQVGHRWRIALVNNLSMLVAMTVAGTLLRRWAPDAGDRLLTGLLRGGAARRSLSTPRSTLAFDERRRVDLRLLPAVPDVDDDRRIAEIELRFRCPGVVRRAVLSAVLAALRAMIRVREDIRVCESQLFVVSRRILWRIGELLADADHLDVPGDIMDLTVAEVLGAVDGSVRVADLRGLIAHRRAGRRAGAERVSFNLL
jgi:hypothetical protein